MATEGADAEMNLPAGMDLPPIVSPPEWEAAADFGVAEMHGTNAFLRDDDDDRIFRAYFVNARGDEAMGGTWSYLDQPAEAQAVTSGASREQQGIPAPDADRRAGAAPR